MLGIQIWAGVIFALAILANLALLFLIASLLKRTLSSSAWVLLGAAALLLAVLNGTLLYTSLNNQMTSGFTLFISLINLIIALTSATGVYRMVQSLRAQLESQQKLNQEQRLLQTILDKLPFPIVLKGRDATYLLTNAAYNTLLGREGEQLLGRKDTDFFPRWQARKNYQAEEAIWQKGAPQATQEEIISANGKNWWEVNRIPILSESGEPFGILIASYNISAYKRMEAELEELRENAAMLKTKEQLEHTLTTISSGFILAEEEALARGINQSLEKIGQLTSSSCCHILLYADNTGLLKSQYNWCLLNNPQRIQGLNDLLSEHAIWDQIPRVEPAQVTEAKAPGSRFANYMRRYNIQSIITIPLIAKREVSGYLWLEGDSEKKHRQWSDLLDSLKLASLVYISALERIKTLQQFKEIQTKTQKRLLELERRERESTLLTEMGDLLQLCRTIDEAYPIISRYTRQLVPSSYGALYLIRNLGEPAEKVTSWGRSNTSALIQEISAQDCWALRRGKFHFISDYSSGLICRHVKKPYPAAYLCAPLTAQGETVGLLHLQSMGEREEERGHFLSQQKTAEKIAEHIALALSNLSLRDRLRSQAIRDPLTYLFNRRYMEETLEREIRRASRHKTPVGIIFIDVDHLKEVNDNFGHDAGDLVLRELGTLLLKFFRGEDIACRFGGDEFTIILPEATISEVWRRAEQLREATKNLTFEYKGNRFGPITLSIGIAAYPDHGANVETLLKVSDNAAYAAKSEGRDRIMIGNALEE